MYGKKTYKIKFYLENLVLWLSGCECNHTELCLADSQTSSQGWKSVVQNPSGHLVEEVFIQHVILLIDTSYSSCCHGDKLKNNNDSLKTKVVTNKEKISMFLCASKAV